MWKSLASVVTGVAVSSFVTLWNPSIPSYTAHVHRLSHLRLDPSSWQIHAEMNASISVQYDKPFTTEVHEASFDLYFPDWQGQLHNIGHLKRQKPRSTVHSAKKQQQQQEQEKSSTLSQEEHLHIGRDNDTIPSAVRSHWTMTPSYYQQQRRQQQQQQQQQQHAHDDINANINKEEPVLFQRNTDLFDYTFHLWAYLQVAAHMWWEALFGQATRWGWISVPISGITQLKAMGYYKVTIWMICDTDLNLWSLEARGSDCDLHRLWTGWNSYEDGVDDTKDGETLRDYVLGLPVNATTGKVLSGTEGQQGSGANVAPGGVDAENTSRGGKMYVEATTAVAALSNQMLSRTTDTTE